jgi:hypothetical protein
MTAAGVAIKSKRWSSHGMQYAVISRTVAVAKAMSAGLVPIHEKPEERERCPERDRILITNKGTNTLKPHAALSPIPIKIPIIFSIPNPLVLFFIHNFLI